MYDIIIIGCGSGGLSIGLFMQRAGFKVLMVSKTDKDIGGECLNDGCVPSKALIHTSRLAHNAKLAGELGLQVSGKVDIKKAISYVYSKQQVIRDHENAAWLTAQGIDVALGEASFCGRKEIEVNGKKYSAKKIIIATGSKPKKLAVPGVEKVSYFDNENIFHIDELPDRLLVVGSGPIGIEIAQAFNRLGSKVTVIEEGSRILVHDDESLAAILLQQLQQEGINFHFNISIENFVSKTEAVAKPKNGTALTLNFDAVFVGIGRQLVLEPLQLQKAGIEIKDHKIVADKKLRTSNKDIFVCGDVAGDLQFSHAAEFHARIILNNLFSPLKKKLQNNYMSWVTFTDPELATFGLSEKQLMQSHIKYKKLEQSFHEDDRAIVDNYQYAKLILFISEKRFLRKQKILGGSMIAPNAGELIQELILAMANKISINAIFNKIYPYPVASRINQKIILQMKQEELTPFIKKLLQTVYKILS